MATNPACKRPAFGGGCAARELRNVRYNEILESCTSRRALNATVGQEISLEDVLFTRENRTEQIT